MKKIFALLLGLLVIPMGAKAVGIFNAESPTVEASELMEHYKQNKFAFAKDWEGRRFVVVGSVNRVDEGRLDGAFSDGPEYPKIILNGLFHAFLIDPNDNLELANIQRQDVFAFDCSNIRGDGLYIQGVCRPALQNRTDAQGKTQVLYLTKDPEVRKFVFSQETIEKLGPEGN